MEAGKAMRRNISGFTVIELLVVIGIIGVLAIIFFENLAIGLRKTELSEAASQIASDFRNARSVAQKQSTDAIVSLTSNNTYTIKQGSVTRSFKVPNNITVSCAGCNANSFTYNAPYGEVTGITTGPVFTLTSPDSSLNTPTTEIRVVGVTGKVVIGKNGL